MIDKNEFQRPRVVIVGAGFGGLWAARAFKQADVDILLIDRNNYHTFLPLLYQVAAAELDPSQIGYPVRSIFRDFDNVDVMLANVERVDVQQQVVVTDAANVDYDYLILATGSVSSFFGIPGAAENTFTMKSIEAGIVLRNHILRMFEQATHEADPERRRRMLTFVVIGGGPSGVEYAGALSELIRGPLAKDYKHLDLTEVQVVLVEGGQNLLLAFPDALGEYAVERLQKMQVHLRLGKLVNAVTPQAVYLNDGAMIPTETAVWTAGVGGEGVGTRSGLNIQRNSTLKVTPTLQLPGIENVYAIGDLAAFELEDGSFLPMVAPVAMQQGEVAAKNIQRQIAGDELETLETFEYHDKGSMAVIGRNSAVAQIGSRAFTGHFAWLIWLVVHLMQLIGFRNRLFVLLNWAWTYWFFENMVRIIVSDKAYEAMQANQQELLED